MTAKLPRQGYSCKVNGFSLVELMIAVAVIAILLTLSYPSFMHFVLKAERTDAQVTLQDWANRQELWRADHPAYSTAINPANTEDYTYSMVSTADSFTLTATATGRQASDKEEGISCATLTLQQDGSPGPDGYQACWAK